MAFQKYKEKNQMTISSSSEHEEKFFETEATLHEIKKREKFN